MLKQAAADKPWVSLLSSASDMDNDGKAPDEAERDEEGNSLDWLLLKERSEVIVPMDTNVSLQR